MKRYVAEFFGTFWLVLGGCGSAVLAATFPDVRLHRARPGLLPVWIDAIPQVSTIRIQPRFYWPDAGVVSPTSV